MAVVVAADGPTATSRGGLNGFNIKIQVTTPAISAPPTISVAPFYYAKAASRPDAPAGTCQTAFARQARASNLGLPPPFDQRLGFDDRAFVGEGVEGGEGQTAGPGLELDRSDRCEGQSR